MTIYAVVNTKGGVGKTTTAVHLATALALMGDTVLIDGDKQGSAAAWAGWRASGKPSGASPTTIRLHGTEIRTQGADLACRFANVVIDVGGSNNDALRSALLLADRVVVPISASAIDTAALVDVFEVVEIARRYNERLDLRVLMARVDSRTRDALRLREALAEQNVPLMQATIGERVAFRRAVAEGLTVGEYGNDPVATAEVQALVSEVTA